MKKSKLAKKALFCSLLTILLSTTMLIGTTFAWFTDTASTSVNKIQAGTLDVVLEMKNPDYNATQEGSKEWIDAEGKTLDFKKAADGASQTILWEPGCTYELPELRISNNGNLALKYNITISGIKGDAKLNEAIEWKINGEDFSLSEKNLSAKQTSETLKITGHMKEDAGNEYQGLSIDGIAITVVATQYTEEYDSEDNQYDKEATYLNTDADGNILIGSVGELRYFAATVNADNDAYAGKTIKLTSDIDLGGAEWTAINMTGIGDNLVTFDGQNHTISNFTVTESTRFTGFFDIANFSIIKNITIDNATVSGVNQVGALVGRGMVTTVENCTVKNSKITTSIHKNDKGNDDDGDKAGAIIGWTDEGICNIKNCTVDNCVITGYRDIAGLVGYYGTTGGVGTVTGNTVTNTQVIQNLEKGYEESTPTTVHEIVGRWGSGFTLDTSKNTYTNVTFSKINE